MGKLYPAWKFSSCGNWDSPSLSKEEFKTQNIQGGGLNANDDLLCYTAKLLTFCALQLVHFLDNSKIQDGGFKMADLITSYQYHRKYVILQSRPRDTYWMLDTCTTEVWVCMHVRGLTYLICTYSIEVPRSSLFLCQLSYNALEDGTADSWLQQSWCPSV